MSPLATAPGAFVAAKSKRGVLLFMVGTVVVVLVAEGARGKLPPDPKILIAAGFVFFVLGLLVEFAPRLANGLAALAFFGAILSRGADAAAGVKKAGKQTKKPGR